MPLLEARGLVVEGPHGARLLDGLDLTLEPGEVHALVGESGAGKSLTGWMLLGLPPPGLRRVDGTLSIEGVRMEQAAEPVWERLRGRRVAMVFQEPARALDPLRRIGDQLSEGPRLHLGLSRAEAEARALRLLEEVALLPAAEVARRYPHELSGGMQQRAVLALALACDPVLLLADEPTTALDATLQAQALDLLELRRRERGAAMLLITHDLGVVAERSTKVSVMYAGRVVEHGPTAEVLSAPRHPYTAALLASAPSTLPFRPRAADGSRTRLPTLPGAPPSPGVRSTGCAFQPRCAHALERCGTERPATTVQGGRSFACHAPRNSEAPT